MPIVINILPNVYWLYNNPMNIQTIGEYKVELRKYSEIINAKTLLELDEKMAFWQKSANFINEIKVEMEKEEFAKLLAILKKINELVKTAYTNNAPIIISTYGTQYLEIGLAIWLFFFNQNAGISFDNVIKLMAYKIIGKISLSDSMKKFFAFLNLNQVSGKM